jgi:hypothetical protein
MSASERINVQSVGGSIVSVQAGPVASLRWVPGKYQAPSSNDRSLIG